MVISGPHQAIDSYTSVDQLLPESIEIAPRELHRKRALAARHASGAPCEFETVRRHRAALATLGHQLRNGGMGADDQKERAPFLCLTGLVCEHDHELTPFGDACIVAARDKR